MDMMLNANEVIALPRLAVLYSNGKINLGDGVKRHYSLLYCIPATYAMQGPLHNKQLTHPLYSNPESTSNVHVCVSFSLLSLEILLLVLFLSSRWLYPPGWKWSPSPPPRSLRHCCWVLMYAHLLSRVIYYRGYFPVQETHKWISNDEWFRGIA